MKLNRTQNIKQKQQSIGERFPTNRLCANLSWSNTIELLNTSKQWLWIENCFGEKIFWQAISQMIQQNLKLADTIRELHVERTLSNMNLLSGSYHCMRKIEFDIMPQRYLYPLYGLRPTQHRWQPRVSDTLVVITNFLYHRESHRRICPVDGVWLTWHSIIVFSFQTRPWCNQACAILMPLVGIIINSHSSEIHCNKRNNVICGSCRWKHHHLCADNYSDVLTAFCRHWCSIVMATG